MDPASADAALLNPTASALHLEQVASQREGGGGLSTTPLDSG